VLNKAQLDGKLYKLETSPIKRDFTTMGALKSPPREAYLWHEYFGTKLQMKSKVCIFVGYDMAVHYVRHGHQSLSTS